MLALYSVHYCCSKLTLACVSMSVSANMYACMREHVDVYTCIDVCNGVCACA